MNENINKNKLYLLKEYSALSTSRLKDLLTVHSQADQNQWIVFIRSFLLFLGVGLTLSGVLFFFAFNWSTMSAGLKFGSIITLLVGVNILSTLKLFSSIVRELFLFSSSLLVGILFAVFGQVYQTGANAYDLFLIWCLAIIPWVMISRFTMHWLLFAFLVNTTLILYFHQVRTQESPFIVSIVLLTLNTFLLLFPTIYGKISKFNPEEYYRGVLLFFCHFVAVLTISGWLLLSNEFGMNEKDGLVLALIICTVYLLGSFLFSLQRRDILLFSYCILSALSIGFILLIKLLSFSTGALLIYSIYAIAGAYFSVKYLIQQQKNWIHEKE